MIVGTAGHIDHGKTTLVRALTGVDTDRLPEEKRRGISIELGYAFLDAPSGRRIGFIDVPGHERLVHTMLAGATGIDHALLLVAADDGVMPQTREHLAVLCLLGLRSATVVITKADRVGSAELMAVRQSVAGLLAGSGLDGSPVLAVSAPSGEGLPALRQRLFELDAAQVSSVDADRAFRLAVDRVFTVEGTGTVVTGTIHAGTVIVGDELCLAPVSGAGLRARVRSLHAQGRAVDRAAAGERCAIGLAGVPRDAVRRGHWWVTPAVGLATDRLDAQLTLWAAETAPLRAGTPVHVHLGATSVIGSVALLDAGDALAPGREARVQLVLREPVAAWHGDRVVLRDASASRTLAGGMVLDPFAPARYRRTPARLAELDALAATDPAQRLAARLSIASWGIDLRRVQAAEGLRQVPAMPSMAPMPATQATPLITQSEGQAHWALGAEHRAHAGERVLDVLRDCHARAPDEIGPDAARLRRLALPRLPEPLWRALLTALQGEGRVVIKGAFVHLPEHAIRLSAVDERIAQKIAPRLVAAGYEGAWARDLARDAQESEPLMRVALARLAQRAEVHQVVRDLVYPVATLHRMARIVRDLAETHAGEVSAAQFRDATALGRKRAIQVLEYFDRIGLTRRVGDVHRVRADCALFRDEMQGGAG